MKQRWNQLSLKVDALTLRERLMVFGGMAAAALFVVYYTLLAPMYARQNVLLEQISRQRKQLAGVDAEIVAKMAAHSGDPDAVSRTRLQHLKAESEQVGAGLRSVQKGLVAPEQIVALLENILRGNGKLRLLSLKTLPVSGMSETALQLHRDAKPNPLAQDAAVLRNIERSIAASSPAPPLPGALAATVGTLAAAQAGTPAGPAGKGAAATGTTTDAAPSNPSAPATPTKTTGAVATTAAPRELLYRHGVEIEVQGAYLDMIDYMAALEALPNQLFWGKARLEAENYPNARLTLTLYTLSLDPNWMTL